MASVGLDRSLFRNTFFYKSYYPLNLWSFPSFLVLFTKLFLLLQRSRWSLLNCYVFLDVGVLNVFSRKGVRSCDTFILLSLLCSSMICMLEPGLKEKFPLNIGLLSIDESVPKFIPSGLIMMSFFRLGFSFKEVWGKESDSLTLLPLVIYLDYFILFEIWSF